MLKKVLTNRPPTLIAGPNANANAPTAKIARCVSGDRSAKASAIRTMKAENLSSAPVMLNARFSASPIFAPASTTATRAFWMLLAMPPATRGALASSLVSVTTNSSALIFKSRKPSAVAVPNALVNALDTDGIFSFRINKSSFRILPLPMICDNCVVTLFKFSAVPPAAATPLANWAIVSLACSADKPTDCRRKEPFTACSKSMPGAFATSRNCSNSCRACAMLYPASVIVASSPRRNFSNSPAATIAAPPMPANGAVMARLSVLPMPDSRSDAARNADSARPSSRLNSRVESRNATLRSVSAIFFALFAAFHDCPIHRV